MNRCPKCGSIVRGGNEFVNYNNGMGEWHVFAYCDRCRSKYDLTIMEGIRPYPGQMSQVPQRPQKNNNFVINLVVGLVIVLIIIPVICGMLSPAIKKYKDKAKEKNNVSDADRTELTTKYENLESDTYEETSETNIYDKEIMFRDIEWGSTYSDVEARLGELNLFPLSGDSYKTYSIDDIILGDYQGIDFEQGDINIIASPINGELNVAGYSTSDVDLFFAYVPVDGILNKKEEESSFYGARYEFQPLDVNAMSNDLITKLTEVYGEPNKETDDADVWGNKYHYVYWEGQGDTQCVLKIQDSSGSTLDYDEDTIYISYIWNKGDELLQIASDTLTQNLKDEESQKYGDGNFDGL